MKGESVDSVDENGSNLPRSLSQPLLRLALYVWAFSRPDTRSMTTPIMMPGKNQPAWIQSGISFGSGWVIRATAMNMKMITAINSKKKKAASAVLVPELERIQIGEFPLLPMDFLLSSFNKDIIILTKNKKSQNIICKS